MAAPRRTMDSTAGSGVAAAVLGHDRLQPDGHGFGDRHARGLGRGADPRIEAAVSCEPTRHRVLDTFEAAVELSADRLYRRRQQQLLLAAAAAHELGGI